MARFPDNALYETILRRGKEFDGKVYIGIRTTKIICFPSCHSRTPLRENIFVFSSVEEAVAEGYRPCKRCRPDSPMGCSPDAVLAEKAESMMRARFPQRLTAAEMAGALYVSSRHLSRTLVSIWGMTLSERWRQLWVEEAKSLLRSTPLTIAEVGERVGTKSPAYFSRMFAKMVGKTPSEYRRNGNGRKL